MIITLCGNTKYLRLYDFFNLVLTLDGHIVLLPFLCQKKINFSRYSTYDKVFLDIMNLAKIDSSDAIFIIDYNGDIGESTLTKMIYAKEKGKPVIQMNEELGKIHNNEGSLFFSKNSFNKACQYLPGYLKSYENIQI